MTREELLKLVEAELGKTKLTLSERTVNEELDDALGDFGDDAEANAAMVTRVAKRLKRMDGNVHAAVSHEVDEYKRNYKPKEEPAAKEGDKGEEIPEWAKKLIDDVNAEKAAREAERTARSRRDLLETVRRGLEEKFEDAGMKANAFFVRSALSRLQLPDKDADVKALVDEAERLYNVDTKEAGLVPDSPRSGAGAGRAAERISEHEWDDVSRIVGRNRPQNES